jgi:hypothetical protein
MIEILFFLFLFKDGILNTIEHRMQTEQNHDLEQWDMKGCSDAYNENHFFDVFATKYNRNDTTSNRYCLSSMVSQRIIVD